MKKRKITHRLFLIFGIFCSSLILGGWKIEKKTEQLCLLRADLEQKAEKICLFQEYQLLPEQAVSEISAEEIQKNRQEEERERRRLERQEKREKKAAKERAKKKKRKEQKCVPASAIRTESRKILLRIVEAEAGDQDLRGRRLVANVILNRVKAKEFPDTVKGVVFSPNQFSPVSNGSYYRVKISKKTKKAVDQALRGVDDSKGALYFMWRKGADSQNAAWFDRALKKLFTHGCHEFFR